jgi:hypothetical protein
MNEKIIVENLKHPLLLVIVFAVILGLIYVGWDYHEANVSEDAARAFVGATPSSDIGGLFHPDPKTPPPPQ